MTDTDTNPQEDNFENSDEVNVEETLENVTSINIEEISDMPEQDDYAVLVALKEENTELKDKMLRALAEVENIRRRSEKEREDTAKYAIAKFARELLGVADNLRRALDSIPEENRESNEQLQNIFIGVESTEKELLRAFDSLGIKKNVPIDEPFNANFHEVMFEADMPDKVPGHVIEVLEAGYMIHDRLLRPARVGVAKKPKLSTEEHIDEEV